MPTAKDYLQVGVQKERNNEPSKILEPESEIQKNSCTAGFDSEGERREEKAGSTFERKATSRRERFGNTGRKDSEKATTDRAPGSAGSNSLNDINKLNCTDVPNEKLKIVYTNARSLGNKLDELFSFFSLSNPDILAITETWLNDEFRDGTVTPKGYKVYRRDRQEYNDKRGGGIAIFVKQELKVSLCQKLNNSKFEETLWLNIHLDNCKPLLVGVCYRAPQSNQTNNDLLLQLLSDMNELESSQILLMGDFNLPGINYEEFTAPDAFSNSFIDRVNDVYLVQHVNFHTRFMNNRSSLIDLIFTDDDDNIDKMTSLPPLGNSDHVCISFDLILMHNTETISSPKDQLNYWKGDYDALNAEFNSIDWDNTLSSNDVNENWLKLKNCIIESSNKFIPIRVARKMNSKPQWLTKKSMRAIKHKHATYAKYKQTGRLVDRANYVTARNKATDQCRMDRKNFEQNLISKFKTKPKLFYKHIRDQQSNRVEISNLVDNDGNTTKNDSESANLLNSFFQSVFTNESEIPRDMTINQRVDPDEHLNDIIFSVSDVSKLLSDINPNKSPGPDKINPKLLKSCPSLAKPLYMIFRQSLDSGVLPIEWKNSNISPIFKKGQRSQPCNYRPVALTSIVCKMMETLIKRAITSHLDSKQLLSVHQHGFQTGRSCLTNLLEAFEIWTRALDDGNQVDCIYLDFAKAFDSVPFERLILKLKAYGINGKLVNWIRDFLVGRKMKVSVRDSSSEWCDVLSGVPQGSVLGPLLFLVYVNDLPDSITSHSKTFADDTKLFRVISSLSDCRELQEDLNRIYSWTNLWLLKLNIQKCKVMNISSSRRETINHNYTMGPQDATTELAVVTEEKDLGIYVSSNLQPSKQCATSVSKANKMLRSIRKSFSHIDRESFLILYKTFIRPNLEHCIQLWSPFLRKDIDLMERVQRRATKIVPQLKHLPYHDRLSQLNLTTLETRRIRGQMIEVYKLLNNFDKINHEQFFELDLSNRRGHSKKLKKQHARTNLRKNFFSLSVVNEWNALPPHVICAKSINSFKNLIDKHYKQREDRY